MPDTVDVWWSCDKRGWLQALPEALREFSDYRMLVYAVVLILVMLVGNNPKSKALLARIRSAALSPFRRRKASGGKEAA